MNNLIKLLILMVLFGPLVAALVYTECYITAGLVWVFLVWLFIEVK